MHCSVQTETFSRVALNVAPQSAESIQVFDYWQHRPLYDLKIAFALQ